ncbi:MAG: C1 family peptidase [Candidatus Thermoplasmatota archaeon]
MNTYGRLLFAISIGIMIAGFSSIFKGKGNEISYAIKADEVFGRDAIIIDIRSTEEYNIAHIKGAISVPYGGCNSCFVNNMESFKGKEIILYCNDGTKSKEAIKLLLENNFTNIKYIEGGINAWKEKGYYLTNENPEYAFSLGFKPLPADIKEEPLNNLNTPLTPPSEWDWRNVNGEDYTTPAKNQGNCGSCWDFAAMGALEAMINIVEGDANLDLDLSEQYILSCYSYGTGCNGGNAYYAYEYIYNNGGAIPETCFPYTGYDTTPCSNKCSDWQHKLVPISGYGYNSTADINAIKSLIVNHGPICLSFDVYSDFYDGSPSFDSNGVYKHQSGYYRGGHQVMCVGYKDTPGNQNYSGYWICKNSWGATWGPWDNGFFGIAYGECNIEGDVVWVSYSSTAPDTFVYGPSGIINYNNVTFNWTGTDGNTPTEYLVYSYILEGYDLNWSEWTSSTSKTYYNLPDGNYTFKVRAKDKAGIPDYTPATLNLTIATANIPPVSIPNGPYSGIAGQQILFNGSNSYDIDGYIVNYTWNFGDGSIGYGASCYHAYTNPGNYTVTLTVIDNEGANSTNSTYAIISAGGEIIDQSQQTYSGEVSIYGTIKYAQSFIPSLSKITKVELYIRKQGLPASLTFSIRESLTGANIVTVVKQASEIPSSLSWITFDFNDINVTVGKTYYIVLETSGGSSSNCYKWGYGSNNPYANGSAWVYIRTWSQLNVDMCFREYGLL